MQGDLMAGDVDKINDTLTNIRLDVTEIKTMLVDVKEKNRDYETRIRLLEQARWRFAGGAAVLGTFGGALASWIVKVMTGG